MTIDELYDALYEENIDLQLMGNISCDDERIKWEYDGLGQTMEEMEAHLEYVCETDMETIKEFLEENNMKEMFFIHEPEISESFIIFEITEE